jgi:5-methyltetrahydrofolate--homocysteine methyltransferase
MTAHNMAGERAHVASALGRGVCLWQTVKIDFLYCPRLPCPTAFTEALNSRPWLLADGATGTNYFQMGLVSGDAPEMWNFEHPERVRKLHREFIQAGADIVLTNTFGGNRHRLAAQCAGQGARDQHRGRAECRAEADAVRANVYVGGSIGPTGEIMGGGPLAMTRP